MPWFGESAFVAGHDRQARAGVRPPHPPTKAGSPQPGPAAAKTGVGSRDLPSDSDITAIVFAIGMGIDGGTSLTLLPPYQLLLAEVDDSTPVFRWRLQQKFNDSIEVNSRHHVFRVLRGERLQGVQSA